jgi:hypothetical protein
VSPTVGESQDGKYQGDGEEDEHDLVGFVVGFFRIQACLGLVDFCRDILDVIAEFLERLIVFLGTLGVGFDKYSFLLFDLMNLLLELTGIFAVLELSFYFDTLDSERHQQEDDAEDEGEDG